MTGRGTPKRKADTPGKRFDTVIRPADKNKDMASKHVLDTESSASGSTSGANSPTDAVSLTLQMKHLQQQMHALDEKLQTRLRDFMEAQNKGRETFEKRLETTLQDAGRTQGLTAQWRNEVESNAQATQVTLDAMQGRVHLLHAELSTTQGRFQTIVDHITQSDQNAQVAKTDIHTL